MTTAERYKAFREHSLLLILEGNVGAGKSTLLKKAKENLEELKRKTKDPSLELEIMIEPIGDWTDKQGNNFLEVNSLLIIYIHTYIYLHNNLGFL